MYIKSIEIKNFRCLHDINIKLGKHITVIAGNNMTGKSTILALLAHCAKLNNKYKPLLKTKFESDWAEIIKTSPSEKQYNRFAKINFTSDIHVDDPTESIEYSTTIQKKEQRYRILPRLRNGASNKNSKKITWAVFYLGLSRLYPIGESEKSEVATGNTINNYFNDIKQAYNSILSINSDEIEQFDCYEIGVKAKKATGIKTNTYESSSNSSGQDNVGQIITAVLSFKKLKKEQTTTLWNGGLLLIDEIDATMHPCALLKLIDYLYTQSIELGIQIVFTTHSMTVLEYVWDKVQHNNQEGENNYELNYLTSANRKVENLMNFPINAIYNDLFRITSPQQRPFQVPIFSEDNEARFFIRNILDERFNNKVKILENSIGHEELLNLLAGDYYHFTSHIFILDGDVANKTVEKYATKAGVQKFKNVIQLPLSENPEKIMYNYLKNLVQDHDIFNNRQLREDGYTYDHMIKTNGPESYNQSLKEREKYKKWFQDNMIFMEELITYWKNDKITEIDRFNEDFKNAYTYIAKLNSRVAL